MARELRFRQFVSGKFHYWGYGVEKFPESFVSPMQSSDGKVHISQQSTGLRDKNGREIYEGDIVLHESSFWDGSRRGRDMCEVVFRNGAWQAKYISHEGHRYQNNAYNRIYSYAKQLDVIGNNHQTPTLLKDNS